MIHNAVFTQEQVEQHRRTDCNAPATGDVAKGSSFLDWLLFWQFFGRHEHITQLEADNMGSHRHVVHTGWLGGSIGSVCYASNMFNTCGAKISECYTYIYI